MPKNKFQDVIFTIIMVFVMVYTMICYNIALNIGGMNNQVGICVVGFAFCFGDNHYVGRIRPESKQQYGWV